MFEQPLTFIFTGRSGCGKGTQVTLLKSYLEKHDTLKRPVFHLETGEGFRKFVSSDGYTNKLSQAVYKNGERQPDFLAIWMWSHTLIEQFHGNEHLIIDGTPRSLIEAQVLDTAMQFYGRVRPMVIHLKVSREWSRKHLMARGRSDDNTAEVKKRLDWYESDVAPGIEFYMHNKNVEYIEINGEQTPEEVHQALVAKIF